jgi:TetR/AcrR family transcriptional regulator, transcriptional repressor for nem operon
MTRDRPADQNTVRNLDSPRQLAEWANTLVAHHRRQLASTTPPLRHASGTASAGIDDSSVAWLLRTWEDLSAGFVSLQHKNLLVDGADPAVLATAFMAALQGGYLLSVTARHIAPLEVAVEMALQQVARSLADETLRAHD